MPSYSHLLGTLIDSIELESDGWHCCLPVKEWAEVLSSFYVLCVSTFGPDKKYYSEAACPYGLCCLILLHWHSSDTRSTYDGSFIQSTSPWNVKYVLQTFHFNLHKSLWSTHICWQCCCCCQVSHRAQWTQVWFCFSFRHSGPIAVFATSTMGVQGGILLGTLVLMGFFVSEKTDAPKDDSSRLHRWLFQWLHSCIHWNFLTCWRFFISCQRFFWSVPPRKMKARAPCLLSKSLPFEKQDIFHAICHQPEWHEAVGQCAWWLCATHRISKTYCNTALIVLPLSTLSRRNIALRQHWMLNKSDICFLTSEFPQGGTYQSSENYHPSFISSMSNISPSWYLGHCPLLSSWLPLE